MYQPLLFKSCKRLTLTVVKATTAGPKEIKSMSITKLLESVKFPPPNNTTTKNKKHYKDWNKCKEKHKPPVFGSASSTLNI